MNAIFILSQCLKSSIQCGGRICSDVFMIIFYCDLSLSPQVSSELGTEVPFLI